MFLVMLASLLITAETLMFDIDERAGSSNDWPADGKAFSQALEGAYLPVIIHILPSPTPLPSPTQPARLVLISEIMYDPSQEEPGAEWLELYNAGSAALQLTGYKLGDAWMAGDPEGMLSFPAGVTLSPGQTVVIANQAATFALVNGFNPDFEMRNSDPQVPNLAKYTAWADRNVELTNGGDEVLLLDGNDQRVDAISWGSSTQAFFPPASRVSQGHSLERYPPAQDTDSALDWRENATPSPGEVNLTPPSPTPTSTPTITATGTTTLTPTRTLTPTWGPSPFPTATPTCTVTAFVPSPTPTETIPSRRLLITEVLYDPVGSEPDAEWIEIYNADLATAFLSDYKVGDEETQGGTEGMLQFPGGTSLAPGQVIVIANRGAVFAARYGFLPDFEMVESDDRVPNMIRYWAWASGSVNLANDNPHDEVLLLDSGDNLADAISWGASTWAFNPSVSDMPEGNSAERYPANRDTQSAQDWRRQNTPDPGHVDLTLVVETATPTPTPHTTITVTPTPTDRPASGLVINEFLADPASMLGDANQDGHVDGGEDEFIELVNITGAALDLSGWSIANAFGVRHVFPLGSQIGNHCATVLFGGGSPTGRFGGSLVQNASTGSLTLRNFGDIVTIYDSSGAPVVTYSYGEEGDDDQSLTRNPDIHGPEPLVKHSLATGSGGMIFSPGTMVDGRDFESCTTENDTIHGSGNFLTGSMDRTRDKIGRMPLLSFNLPDHHHHFTLDLNDSGIIDVDGLHGGIGRLETNLPIFQVEILEGGFIPISQPNGHQLTIARFSGRFHDYDVPIVDHGVDHRIALDFEGKQIRSLFTGRQHAASDADDALCIVIGEVRRWNRYGYAGENPSHHRNTKEFVDDLADCLGGSLDLRGDSLSSQCATGLRDLFHEPDAPGYTAIPLDIAHLFQLIQIIVYNRGG
jgi:hypothetical protein